MGRLKQRLSQLQRRGPNAARPRIIPFPTEGLSEQEIEEKPARWDERGPMTDDERVAEFNVERA